MFWSKLVILLGWSTLLVTCTRINENSDSKPVYQLKCQAEMYECSLMEFNLELAENAIDQENKKNEDISQEVKLNLVKKRTQNLFKRFFSNRNDPIKIYKTKEINCLTEDCKFLTAKIEKRTRNGAGTLTCVGDPYSNSGSRCVPIEGLYIG